MSILIALATLIVGLLVGFFAREVWLVIKRIEMAVRVLYVRQKKEEQKEKRMGLAGPVMSMEEYMQLEEDERLEALNSKM